MTNETPKDDELSRLYREAAGAEPPPALDAAIRAAAREAVAARPARPRPWWLRWRLPVGVFATLVLTVSLTLLVEREQEREAATAQAPAATPAVEAAAPPRAPAVTGQRAAMPTEEKSAPAPRRAVPQRSEPAAGEPAAAAAPAVGGVLAPAPASEAYGADALRARPAPAEDRISGQAERAAAPLMKRELKSAAPAALVPEAWIAEIRRLRAEGREAEAQRQLAEFVSAHPDYRLPDDLRR